MIQVDGSTSFPRPRSSVRSSPQRCVSERRTVDVKHVSSSVMGRKFFATTLTAANATDTLF